MAYRQFKMPQLKREFGLREKKARIFENVAPIEPSKWLQMTLRAGQEMQLITEKAKSEFVVAPMLMELCLRSNKAFSVFSGVTLKVDTKRNLNGECDFLLSSQDTIELESAVFALVEAKNGLIDEGIPQCAAQMLAARIFNGEDEVQNIYGCVTNTDEWQFLKLEGQTLIIDKRRLYFNELPLILGTIITIAKQYVDLPELAAEPILA